MGGDEDAAAETDTEADDEDEVEDGATMSTDVALPSIAPVVELDGGL